MKIKSTVAGGLIIAAATMFVAVGTLQAHCYRSYPGWHMVSKKCNIRPAENWQEYTSGVYLQPMVGKGIF
jgi:hypothetical protein